MCTVYFPDATIFEIKCQRSICILRLATELSNSCEVMLLTAGTVAWFCIPSNEVNAIRREWCNKVHSKQLFLDRIVVANFTNAIHCCVRDVFCIGYSWVLGASAWYRNLQSKLRFSLFAKCRKISFNILINIIDLFQ